ncbi:MAG: hypothetical protein JW918_19505 [Anaerolineae bacterium]|nr:hypothetical protein [Anaerolineae bacterium]
MEKPNPVLLLRLAGATALALLLLLLLSVISGAARTASPSRLSAQVTPIWLGNPIADEDYAARHIWDLQVWRGRVYLGYGDWDTNQGPVRIWYYTPTASVFVSETVYVSETRPAALVDEEAIDRYVVISGDLYIPGTDPLDSWDWGNFYRNDGAGWVKYRTIPLGIHVFDLASYGGELFAAIGPDDAAGLLRSGDGGLTWTSAISEVYPDDYLNRFYELYELGGTLFAVKSPTGTLPKPSVYRYQYPGFVTTTIDLVPDQTGGLTFVRDDVFVFGDSILYVPWSRETVTSALEPISALYRAHIWQNGQRVAFFDGKYPRDVVVAGGWVYVLDAGGPRCIVGEGPPDPAGYTATLYASMGLAAWLPVATAHFTDTPNALEVLDGVAYVGTYNGDVYALPLVHHVYYFPQVAFDGRISERR